jgi:cell shape-determining protein MreC
VNFRFPEVFGVVLFVVLLCSFALPRSVSGRIENTFQFVFAPVAGPIQWVTAGKDGPTPRDVPLLPEVSDEVARLRQEKVALMAYIDTLRGQLQTLSQRQSEAEVVGEKLRDLVTPVKVISVDAAAGREVLRLSGSTAATIAKDQPVITDAGLVGKVQEVGVGRQSSVRLITDRGFKLRATFCRYANNDAGGVEQLDLPLPATIAEGVGNGSLRVDGLRWADVQRADLKVGDTVLLGDRTTEEWQIEVHGYRIGLVSKVGEKIDAPGVAEIWVKPAVNLLALKDVMVVTKK